MEKIYNIVYDIPTVIAEQKTKINDILSTAECIRADIEKYEVSYSIRDKEYKTIKLRPIYDMGLRKEVTEVKLLTNTASNNLFYYIPDTELLTVAYNLHQSQARRVQRESIRKEREYINNFLNTFTYDKIKTI